MSALWGSSSRFTLSAWRVLQLPRISAKASPASRRRAQPASFRTLLCGTPPSLSFPARNVRVGQPKGDIDEPPLIGKARNRAHGALKERCSTPLVVLPLNLLSMANSDIDSRQEATAVPFEFIRFSAHRGQRTGSAELAFATIKTQHTFAGVAPTSDPLTVDCVIRSQPC